MKDHKQINTKSLI